jgi:hypothetical protein
MTDRYGSFVISDPDASVAVLRADLDQQGYLFFRGLLPAADVLAVRHAVLAHCAEAGWLDPSSDPIEGIIRADLEPMMEGQPGYMAVYRKILHTPLFHEFPQHPRLMQIAAKLIDGDVLVHPRRIGRLAWPNYTAATTPAHQDHFYIRGSVQTYSCWTPLGACPPELGGLAVWPGSQHQGYLEHTVRHPGAVGGYGVPADQADTWHTIDYQPGDALFFHAYTIHKALPNLTENRLRISTDNRYQGQHDAIDPSALRPHYDLNVADTQ